MKDKPNFKVEEDVSALRKAIEGIGKLDSAKKVSVTRFFIEDKVQQICGVKTSNLHVLLVAT